ncbi:hypothetical protein K461DRAFT_315616 [Myriangium duriaei CBS 260.36]|uniref:Uncharacterized protein n=1 Tax=Myriangium duriaei CBS 260.36 TaxID=1168546 RepID=A0A9P4IZE8_9PEZI|nr:hypothetical protein K461DRAFT_315616 [Myriangium duriaei CBS 260.36]
MATPRYLELSFLTNERQTPSDLNSRHDSTEPDTHFERTNDVESNEPDSPMEKPRTFPASNSPRSISGKTHFAKLQNIKRFWPDTSKFRLILQRLESKLGIVAWGLPEVFALLGSVICLVSIIIILFVFDGQSPTDVHLPRSLTLNGLIAIISTINRGCLSVPLCSAIMQEMWLHFGSEVASVSSWPRLRDVELYTEASQGVWGSFMFLMHPRRSTTFTQQLFSIDFKSMPNDIVPGSIPRAETYKSSEGMNAHNRLLYGAPTAFVAALYSGVLAGPTFPATPSCLTGNCSWPLTPTLAVCGACKDSTFTKGNCSDLNCDYTLASGATVTFQTYGTAFASVISISDYRVTRNVGSELSGEHYLIYFELFGAPYDGSGFVDDLAPLSNQECALWFCINVYDTLMHSGQPVESLVATFPPNNYGDPGTLNFLPLNSTFDAHNETSFMVDRDTMNELQSYLETSMQTNVSKEMNTVSGYSSDLSRGIYQGSANAKLWINGVTAALSTAVRAQTQSDRAQYRGTAYQIVIVVRWPWLAFPAALVLLSALLLVVVITRTARNGVISSWKGSPLTLLLFDIDEETKQAAYRQIDERQGVMKAIGLTRVMFTREEGGNHKFKTC